MKEVGGGRGRGVEEGVDEPAGNGRADDVEGRGGRL